MLSLSLSLSLSRLIGASLSRMRMRESKQHARTLEITLEIKITKEAREWLEIDLHTIHLITAIASQGRFGNGVGVEFAEAYMLEYWRPRLGKWVRYRDIKGEEVSTLT